MLYELLYPLSDSISALNLFKYITFRTAGAMVTALFISLILGPFFIRLLKKYQIRETIRTDGPKTHLAKEGTPTMGGLVIICAIVVPTVLWADISNFYILMALLVTMWLGLIGYMDDYLKAVKGEPKGIVARKKLIGQITLGIIFGSLLVYIEPSGSFDGTTGIPFFKNYLLDLGIFYIPFIILVLTATSNAVNLTDGADGLAIGLAGLCFITFGGLAYVTGRVDFSNYLQIQYLPGA